MPTEMFLCAAASITLLVSSWATFVGAQSLTSDQVGLVKQRLAEGATHSWEYGTRAQTLLELDAAPFSVLSPFTLPPANSLNSSANASLSDVFSIAQKIVSGRSKSNNNATGPQPLISDASAGDPASIGVAVLLANWTGMGGQDGLEYGGAAQDQLNFLYSSSVPKTSDGAISHRTSEVQLWSDSVYMVPPFLAYYGVLSGNQTLISEAYTQIQLYRNYLVDNKAGGLWKHVLLGASGNDEGHWSTGNAWAAAGMLRVLGTMKNSPYSKSFKNEIKNLGQWTFDIQKAMYSHLQSNNLFKNYADGSDSGNFDDASSTALLAATVYRLSLLTGTHTYLPYAERCRTTLFSLSNSSSSSSSSSSPASSVSSSTATSSTHSSATSTQSSASASATPTVFAEALHFSSDGWLTPVVNPNSYGSEGSNSPESEAFVLQLHAAWRDWAADGAQGANAAIRVLPSYCAYAIVMAVSVLSVFGGW
ncbi:hypothetical protein EW146_g4644 [Bondarzewia mesenterica]|uniref:Uncharacterized protein n=1 Tax=Bondarzewia mesenterica TaxID=1095465 RepID=A0A4S4LTX1_9AGAM|nr:hypothetical protein EW146_g4644 [Bondarzewia mesenterica]